jgi:uncharacterized SAM-binding protein YcdF (DUF218 family)
MKKLTLAIGLVLLILLGLYLTRSFFLNQLASFLVVRDELQKADVILVLAGDDNGERVVEGVKLFKQGYAPWLLMSGGPLSWELTAAEWMKKQAVAAGVPSRAILLQAESKSTLQDARFCLPIMQHRGFKSVILVTSPYHARRAGGVVKKAFAPAGIKVINYPATKSIFKSDRWWQRHEDAAFVVWEYVSLVLYFFRGYL